MMRKAAVARLVGLLVFGGGVELAVDAVAVAETFEEPFDGVAQAEVVEHHQAELGRHAAHSRQVSSIRRFMSVSLSCRAGHRRAGGRAARRRPS
jgi:hypothetical protein